MEVFEAVKTVLAVRSYQDKPVPADVVRRIVEAGQLTASSQNGQPWHFIVVQNRDLIKRLAEVERTGTYIAEAPVVVVVAIDKTKFGVSDGSRAIQSMILTAWSEGIGSNWVGYLGPNEVKPILGIPDEMDVLAAIPFGYPTQHRRQGKKNRKPLGQVASSERLGHPFK